MSARLYDDITSASARLEAGRVWASLSPGAVKEHAKLRWLDGGAESAARRLLQRSQFDVETGCANWRGPCHWNGYAECYVGAHNILGHRLSWWLFVGDLESLWVLHKCDNQRCLNPFHLFLGTRQDNMDDMVAKGRANAPRGEAAPSAKITRVEALTIRSAYRPRVSGKHNPNGFKSIADRFGISTSQVRAIVRGRKWAWLTNNEKGQ